eukprot:scaffold70256_cov22-Cyclotella_meneghiniana.AAC.1
MERVLPPWVNSEKLTTPSLTEGGVQGLLVRVVDRFDNSVDDMLPRADKQSAMGSCVINGLSSEGWLITIVVCRDEREF